MKLLLKFPTRQRPDKFKKTLNVYLDNLSDKHDITILVSCDTDDMTMNNDAMVDYLQKIPNLTLKFGESKSKVQAINADLNEHNKDWDICLLASDDMIPQVKGYDDIICKNMEKYYPKLDGVLHFNDGRAGKRLNTLCIFGRKYYERFKYIYHPDYISLWCDNEFQLVSESLGRATYIPDVIIRHAWTDYTGSDTLHKINESFYSEDNKVFKKRRKLKFPTTTTTLD